MGRHVERFKIPLKPGWRKTRRDLLRFCRDYKLEPPRFSLQPAEIPQELANLERISCLLRDSTVPAEKKVRFNWLLAFLESCLRQVVELERIPLEEFFDTAHGLGFESTRKDQMRL